MPLRSITNYLQRWGYTAQRPTKRAYEQDPVKVKAWMEETYPEIQKKAKAEKGEIYWGDETGVQNDAYRAKVSLPKAKRRVVRLQAKRSKISMLSAITNLGRVRFHGFRGCGNLAPA